MSGRATRITVRPWSGVVQCPVILILLYWHILYDIIIISPTDYIIVQTLTGVPSRGESSLSNLIFSDCDVSLVTDIGGWDGDGVWRGEWWGEGLWWGRGAISCCTITCGVTTSCCSFTSGCIVTSCCEVTSMVTSSRLIWPVLICCGLMECRSECSCMMRSPGVSMTVIQWDSSMSELSM